MFTKKQSLESVIDTNMELMKVSKQFEIEKEAYPISIEETCLKKGINTDFFVEILNVFHDAEYLPTKQLLSFPLPVVLGYLKRTHIYFLKRRLPEIEQSINGSFDSNLGEYLRKFFLNLKQSLTDHIISEERDLFPYISALYDAVKNEMPMTANITSIENYISTHNDDIEKDIMEVRKYIVAFHDSADALFPYRVLLQQLDMFEKELRVHAFVEDEVLIPKAKNLEEEFL